MSKCGAESCRIVSGSQRTLRGQTYQPIKLFSEQKAGRMDAFKVRDQRFVFVAAGILDQEFGQFQNGGDRRREFLAHEGRARAFEALVWIRHVKSEPAWLYPKRVRGEHRSFQADAAFQSASYRSRRIRRQAPALDLPTWRVP